MKEKQTNTENNREDKDVKRPRFKIEKLEERIAPAKGGVPGTNGGGSSVHGRGGMRY